MLHNRYKTEFSRIQVPDGLLKGTACEMKAAARTHRPAKRKWIPAAAIAACLAVAVLSGVLMPRIAVASQQNEPTDRTIDVPAPPAYLDPTLPLKDEPNAVVDFAAPPLTLEQLAESRSTIVRGVTESYYYTLLGARPYTVATVRVTESLRGGLHAGDLISVVYSGGYYTYWDEELAIPGIWTDRFPDMTKETMISKATFFGIGLRTLIVPGQESVYFFEKAKRWEPDNAFDGAYFCSFFSQYYEKDGVWQRFAPKDPAFFYPRNYDEQGNVIDDMPEDYLPTGEPAYTYDDLRAAIGA